MVGPALPLIRSAGISVSLHTIPHSTFLFRPLSTSRAGLANSTKCEAGISYHTLGGNSASHLRSGHVHRHRATPASPWLRPTAHQIAPSFRMCCVLLLIFLRPGSKPFTH